MEAIKNFLTKETAITDSFSVQTWMFIALAVAIVLIVLIVVSAVKNSKSSGDKQTAAPSEPENKEIYIPEEETDETSAENADAEADSSENADVAAPSAAETENTAEEEAAEETAEEEAAEETAEDAETENSAEETAEAAETVEEETQAAETVEEETQAAEAEEVAAAEAEEEKAVETTEATAVPEEEKEAVFEEKAETSEAVSEEKPLAAKPKTRNYAKKAEKSEKVAESKKPEAETSAESENAKSNQTLEDKSEDEEMKLSKKKETKPEPKAKAKAAKPAVKEEEKKVAVGKFEICNSVGGYRYMLLANNGQLLYESRDYKSADACKEAVGKFVNAVEKGEFKVRADKFGLYKFNLKSPTSSNVIYVGESYTTRKACLSVVESVKRFAPVSPVVDITQADYVADAEIFDIPEDIRKAVESGTGAVGRWEIALSEPENEKSPYVYLLFANNGQLLYESREYKTEDSCRSGIDTFVKTLSEGVFIIDKDKFGRFKFILRSRRAGSQVEYVGQNYQDRPSCINSAVSVFKFGLLTKAE